MKKVVASAVVGVVVTLSVLWIASETTQRIAAERRRAVYQLLTCIADDEQQCSVDRGTGWSHCSGQPLVSYCEKSRRWWGDGTLQQDL